MYLNEKERQTLAHLIMTKGALKALGKILLSIKGTGSIRYPCNEKNES